MHGESIPEIQLPPEIVTTKHNRNHPTYSGRNNSMQCLSHSKSTNLSIQNAGSVTDHAMPFISENEFYKRDRDTNERIGRLEKLGKLWFL